MCISLTKIQGRSALAVAVALLTSVISGTTAVAQPVSKTATSNPDLSVNALFLYRNGSRGNTANSTEPNGPSLQEAEVQFFSDVDPYTRLSALLSVHQEAGEWKLEPEELFAETLAVPQATLKIGKFKAALGKHNTLHTHAYPFIDAPLLTTVLLGEEGLNDAGGSAAMMIPAPWFSELTLQILSGQVPGSVYFNSKSPNDNVFVAHAKNLWDLSDELTAEFGLSGAYGKNEFDIAGVIESGTTAFSGADLTFKWRPSEGGKYRALIWATEYLNRQINRPGSTRNDGQGIASWLQYQFTERWWAQVRGEYLKVLDTDTVTPLDLPPHQRKYSALIGFVPSEFSAFRLQYHYLDDGNEKPEHRVMLQANFTIGAHPAHSY